MCSGLVLAISSGFSDLNPKFALRLEVSTQTSRKIYMNISPIPEGAPWDFSLPLQLTECFMPLLVLTVGLEN